MGTRGPIANPNSQRYIGRSKPKTMADIPADALGKAKMPAFLKGDARKFWRDHAAKLEELGRLTKLDESAFSVLCDTYSMLKKLDLQIETDGFVLTGPRGATRPHPLLRTRDTWLRSFLQGCKEFGLTPVSRARLPAVAQRADTDPFEVWLNDSRGHVTDIRSRKGAS